MAKPSPLTDDQLDAMTPHQRVLHFKSLGFDHNASCFIGHAQNRDRRNWELRIARGENAARHADDPNELTKERDGAREDAEAEQHRQ